jgi:hypothetical protein
VKTTCVRGLYAGRHDHWNGIALTLLGGAGWATLRESRLLSALNTAQADAFIACWDARSRGCVGAVAVRAYRAQHGMRGSAYRQARERWQPARVLLR